jgi:lysophospholipase L1-like esterase
MPRLLIALLLVGATAALTGPAAANTAVFSLADDAPVYLALGDSLAFGTGASEPEATGYVPHVYEALREHLPCQPEGEAPCPELQLLNLGENGATTETMLETQLPAAIDILERRNGDDVPGNDVRVVTLDIGGNDAVGGLFDVCADEVTAACPAAVQATLTTIERNLTAILMQLRGAAGPDTEIAVMTYYNALVGCDYSDVAGNAELVLNGVPGVMPGLNGVIRQVAERAQVTVADTFGKLGPDDLVGGPDCLHANDAGYRKIATVFIEVLVRPGVARAGS